MRTGGFYYEKDAICFYDSLFTICDQ